ncbi:MAG: hypothetical protein EA370_08710 [Wenzhouxiangella sp.]|nr:MAG: hypothetical protein EA370_08710 [Wenzhouxiangella sp.]
MIDRSTLVIVQGCLVGRTLIGKNDPVVVEHQGHQHQDGGVDCGDRHMAVPGTARIQRAESRIKPPLDHQVIPGQLLSQASNQRRTAHLDRAAAIAALLQAGPGHQGILATAHGNQAAALQGHRCRLAGRISVLRKGRKPGRVQPVTVSKLCQPATIEVSQPGGLFGIGRH